MKGKKVFLFFCIVIGLLLVVAGIWTETVEQHAHKSPKHPPCELEGILAKEEQELSGAEYALLQQQTGLSEAGIRSLWQQGRQQELLVLQERLYAPIEVRCSANTVISREERIISGQEGLTFSQAFPTVEPGDILISFNCHVLGWRSGHAALVVDCERGLSLEARVLGTDTAFIPLESWLRNPSVAVLRVKGLKQEQRQAVAEYAAGQLVGIPYSLLSGKGGILQEETVYAAKKQERNIAEGRVTDEKQGDVLLQGTHCAHLVWTAFSSFGIDLDGDGGLIVTPRDLYESEWVEIVQQYGM